MKRLKIKLKIWRINYLFIKLGIMRERERENIQIKLMQCKSSIILMWQQAFKLDVKSILRAFFPTEIFSTIFFFNAIVFSATKMRCDKLTKLALPGRCLLNSISLHLRIADTSVYVCINFHLSFDNNGFFNNLNTKMKMCV